MKSQELEVTIAGKKAILGYQYLISIVDNIEDILENTEIFETLVSITNSIEMKITISQKDSLNRATIKNLLKEQNDEIYINLLSNFNSAKQLKKKDIYKVLDMGKSVYAERIANNLEFFENCNIYKLAKNLLKYEDPSVRMTLANRWHTPKKILK